MQCTSCERDHDVSTRLTGDIILCACGAHLLVRHGNGATALTPLGARSQLGGTDELDNGSSELLPRRASGLFLSAAQLYALACRSFDFWHRRSPSGACWQVYHNGQIVAEVASPAQARIVIVERFKALLTGGDQ